MPILSCRRVWFYSPGDELAFFTWLKSIEAVRKIEGSGDAILLHVSTKISDESLRELLAIFLRYRIDLPQLAQFETPKNRVWFAAPNRRWHKRVFRLRQGNRS